MFHIAVPDYEMLSDDKHRSYSVELDFQTEMRNVFSADLNPVLLLWRKCV